jgi:hypothetical protein
MTIITDTMEDEPSSVNLPTIPNLNSHDTETRIAVLFKLYKRASFKKDRVLSLWYMFQIGKCIFSVNLSQKGSGLTVHYYMIAKRIFVIFESDEAQIMRTKVMTIVDIRRISQEEFKNLVR